MFLKINVELSVGLLDSSPSFAREIGTSKLIFVCDPPTLAQYVRIETDEFLYFCEVQVYATGK